MGTKEANRANVFPHNEASIWLQKKAVHKHQKLMATTKEQLPISVAVNVAMAPAYLTHVNVPLSATKKDWWGSITLALVAVASAAFAYAQAEKAEAISVLSCVLLVVAQAVISKSR